MEANMKHFKNILQKRVSIISRLSSLALLVEPWVAFQ